MRTSRIGRFPHEISVSAFLLRHGSHVQVSKVRHPPVADSYPAAPAAAGVLYARAAWKDTREMAVSDSASQRRARIKPCLSLQVQA